MIFIRRMGKENSNKEVLNNINGRIDDIERMLDKMKFDKNSKHNASLVRIVKLHCECIREEICMLKEREKES